MHPAAREWCSRWASGEAGQALDVGGRNVNGTVRDLWPNMTWTVLDIEGDPGNHRDRVITADVRTWVPDRRYDLVLSTELLEHIELPDFALLTMVEALDTDGLLIITCAGPGRLPHSMNGDETLGPAEHYQNIDPQGLSVMLKYHGLHAFVNYFDRDTRAAAIHIGSLRELSLT